MTIVALCSTSQHGAVVAAFLFPPPNPVFLPLSRHKRRRNLTRLGSSVAEVCIKLSALSSEACAGSWKEKIINLPYKSSSTPYRFCLFGPFLSINLPHLPNTNTDISLWDTPHFEMFQHIVAIIISSAPSPLLLPRATTTETCVVLKSDWLRNNIQSLYCEHSASVHTASLDCSSLTPFNPGPV